MKAMRLGVNIDHIATLRQARRAPEPDPVAAAIIAELAGADGITVHLRGDRRHIQDEDVRRLRQTITTRLNLEMAPNAAMIETALQLSPDTVTLVPEFPNEITTQGGLDLWATEKEVSQAIECFREKGIDISLFIDPMESQVFKAVELGVSIIELNTSAYSEAVPRGLHKRDKRFLKEIIVLENAAATASARGLAVYAGHGLTYRNIEPVACIPQIEEFNIGHNIIARASLVGLDQAVKEMIRLIEDAGN